MTEKLYRVFISSTFEDLGEERQQLLVHLLKTNFVPIGMELFAASGKQQFERIKKYIDQSDYYVVVIKERYGSVSKEDGKSYTEKEYDYALETLGKQQVLVFPSKGHILYNDLKNGEKLKAFRERATAECMAYFWSDAGDLKANVVHALGEAVKEDERSDAGWVRANTLVADAETAKQLVQAKQERDTKQAELRSQQDRLIDLQSTCGSLLADERGLRNQIKVLQEAIAEKDREIALLKQKIATLPPASKPKLALAAGDTYRFGPYDWLVLAVKGNQALLFSEDIIEKRKYHDVFQGVTWETSDLRKWLNGKFFERFNTEKKKILKAYVINPSTKYTNDFGVTVYTQGGNNTEDFIFLLSISEAEKLLQGDQFCATDWWWLRSPGESRKNAACVDKDGLIYKDGSIVSTMGNGVRPALWLNLDA